MNSVFIAIDELDRGMDPELTTKLLVRINRRIINWLVKGKEELADFVQYLPGRFRQTIEFQWSAFGSV